MSSQLATMSQGHPPARLQSLFEMFQTLSTTTENTGIGLAIVKKIIESEGGKIARSTSVGMGTTYQSTRSESVGRESEAVG